MIVYFQIQQQSAAGSPDSMRLMELEPAEDAFFRQVIGSQIKDGPDELGPDVISDGPRVGFYQCKEALGCDHAPHRIKSSRDQLPLLDVAKENAKDEMRQSVRLERESGRGSLHRPDQRCTSHRRMNREVHVRICRATKRQPRPSCRQQI
jgi:hypothetical protein